MKETKKKESSKVQDIKCPVCGRETPHYVDAQGNVRCSICQHVAKVITLPGEVVFEVDEEFDKELNGADAVSEENYIEEADIQPEAPDVEIA